MTFSTRTAAVMVSALLAVGSIGLADATTAPSAQAVDFYGAGARECPAALATQGKGLGFVTTMAGARTYASDIDLGTQATSAAWLRAPRTSHTVAGQKLSSPSGYMVIDRAGSAYFVRQADNGMLLSKTKIRGPWRGLRAIVGAAPTGRPDAASTATRVMYGITTGGGLVRMPISWNAKGIPGVGARKTLGTGYRDYVALRFSGYTHEANTPVSDHLVGITSSGRFVRVEAARTGRVTLRILARSGFSGLTDFVTDQCWQDGASDAWLVRGKNGSLARYVDPDVTDTTLRGLTKTPLRGTLPAGVRLL